MFRVLSKKLERRQLVLRDRGNIKSRWPTTDQGGRGDNVRYMKYLLGNWRLCFYARTSFHRREVGEGEIHLKQLHDKCHRRIRNKKTCPSVGGFDSIESCLEKVSFADLQLRP